ncbi:two-component system response regulator CreB [Pelagicoccus sp. SDUM812002]|uniref:two-component system response regulator CreB n=1 Tax=Pelagicoccus sp. SDUM812002 TaxID=3041266 RepID=UPI00280D5EBE|nr:two-component system response regulator CreB [Pelagicoccus sp. SDUM812002]MDQ8186571.1 two-component system response regulator CreB [Pelagicoccus sp. SDUM812002]
MRKLESNWKRPCVLIIEDEPSIADNIRFGLGKEGFENEWVSTGVEGLRKIAENEYVLVILDVGLPDTTGFEVCKQIRSFSQVPIIFLTARNEEIDRILGLEIGGDDYVCKPFSVRELVARVRVILRRGTSLEADGETAGKELGPFRLDGERYQISISESPLNLTRYEYRMLKVLLERPGRVLTREQLMYQVWEEPEASGERTVDAHVKSIRAKLREASPGNEYIVTHRGIGYSMQY